MRWVCDLPGVALLEEGLLFVAGATGGNHTPSSAAGDRAGKIRIDLKLRSSVAQDD